MKPGNASERTLNKTVAAYVLMTLISSEVKKVRMINVNKSPNDDASGVAILSRIRCVVKTQGTWIDAKSARHQNQ
jgi:hypothetical protein